MRVGRAAGFDSRRFYADLQRAARAAGVSMGWVSIETGVDSASLARIGSRGAVPDGINLAALCKWAGLNAADYSVDLRGECDE